MAAFQGNLKVLKWLRSFNPPCPIDYTAYDIAHNNGHFHMIDFIMEEIMKENINVLNLKQ
jgi:hypothetical protein